MDSEIGTLLAITGLLGIGGAGLYFYGDELQHNLTDKEDSDITIDNHDDDNIDDQMDSLTVIDSDYNFKNTKKIKNNKTKRHRKRVSFNSRRRYY